MPKLGQYQSGVNWNVKKNNEYELSGRKAVKFKFKKYKDYLKENKKITPTVK